MTSFCAKGFLYFVELRVKANCKVWGIRKLICHCFLEPRFQSRELSLTGIQDRAIARLWLTKISKGGISNNASPL